MEKVEYVFLFVFFGLMVFFLMVYDYHSPEKNFARGYSAIKKIEDSSNDIKHWSLLLNSYENSDAGYSMKLALKINKVFRKNPELITHANKILNEEELSILEHILEFDFIDENLKDLPQLLDD